MERISAVPVDVVIRKRSRLELQPIVRVSMALCVGVAVAW